jgi:competence protein ComEC
MKKRRAKSAGFFVKAAALLIFLVLSVFRLSAIQSGGLSLYAFDVGQGDAFLFHLPDGQNVMIDAGTLESAPALVTRLKSLGIRKIDILAASHPHEDHIGGMPSVLRAFNVGRFWDSGYNHGSEIQRTTLKILRDKKIRFERPKAGHAETLGDVAIEVIAPSREIRGTNSDANNNSLVVRISYGDVSFLMTGDMETEERNSIRKFPRSTVLKISHHGGENGSDARIMRETAPSAAILTYGLRNSYGHPHASVTELIRKSGARSYATADGEIIMNTDGRKLTVKRSDGLLSRILAFLRQGRAAR